MKNLKSSILLVAIAAISFAPAFSAVAAQPPTTPTPVNPLQAQLDKATTALSAIDGRYRAILNQRNNLAAAIEDNALADQEKIDDIVKFVQQQQQQIADLEKQVSDLTDKLKVATLAQIVAEAKTKAK